MYKEITIIVVIITIIILGDYITQNFTKENVKDLIRELNLLKQSIIDNSYNDAKERTDKIQAKINKIHHKLSYYLEHNEIEKIEIAFASCRSFLIAQDYVNAECEAEKMIFLVNHLTDKYRFNLDNIF